MDEHAIPEADAAGVASRAAEDARLRLIRTELIELAGTVAAAEARRVRLLAEVAEIAAVRTSRMGNGHARLREMALRSIAAEFGMALRVNDRTMQGQLGAAEQLARLFPATVEAMAAGRVSRAHADAIADAGCVIDDSAVRAAFEHVMLEHAVRETPSRTRAFARRMAEQLHPRSIEERFADASEERAITVTELADGMAELRALLPAALAFGILDRLTRQAKAIESVTRRSAASGRPR